MLRFTFISYLLLSFNFLMAQLPNGTVVQNFTFTDIEGNDHTLYDYLDAGKTVYIDVFATWCGPCWSYHNTHAFSDFYELYGPDGEDVAMMFGIEGSASTTVANILGSGSNTYGDWTEGVDYPIFNDTYVAQTILDIGYYPTIYKICPIEKTIQLIGQANVNSLYNHLIEDGCNYPFFSLESDNSTVTGCLGENQATSSIAIDSPWSNEMGTVMFSGQILSYIQVQKIKDWTKPLLGCPASLWG